jgi:hypothetical protein
MTDEPTTGATILPFPARPLPASLRLERALGGLEEALAEQRAALADFHAALGELRGAASSLQGALTGYHAELGTLAGKIDGLGTEARLIERRCDQVLRN